jgi:hypothetical protein
MDETSLAHEVVDQIAPFLSELMAKKPLPSGADPGKRQIYAVWDELYPKVALRSGVMLAARKILEEDTPEHREALSKQLALVFRINTFLAEKINNHLPGVRQKFSSKEIASKPHAPAFTPMAGEEEKEYNAEHISCQVCGDQDHSLRLVSYPFVFSLIVITFRRMFQGVYCSRHANRYFVLAVIITLSVGWLGIPFGLIFTPITLFNLFTSEKRLRVANAKLLLEIAKAKQEKGDLEQAAVFYQESLWLNHKEIENLPNRQIASMLAQTENIPFITQVFSLISGIAAAWLIGFLIGLVDGLVSSPFNQLQGQVSFLVIIFSYLPLVLMLYFGSFVLARFIRRMLERTRISNTLVGTVLAGIASLTAFYAILTGHLFFYVQSSTTMAASLVDMIRVNGLLLVHGGWLTVLGLFETGSTADLLFFVIVIFGFMAFLWLGLDWAGQTVRLRKTLENYQEVDPPDSGVWVAASAVLIVGVLFIFLGLLFIPSQILFN